MMMIAFWPPAAQPHQANQAAPLLFERLQPLAVMGNLHDEQLRGWPKGRARIWLEKREG